MFGRTDAAGTARVDWWPATVAEAGRGEDVSRVPVEAIKAGDSPRDAGLDDEHVRVLAGVESPLPPILVHRSTMQVIDGAHRLAAARLRGRSVIEVRFFDGSSEEAFRLGVVANVTHGLPLSLADRRGAAARLVATHPQLSDRAIARSVGLSPKTVASIRNGAIEEQEPQEARRVGMDGRSRPLNPADRRLVASRLVERRPEASLREIAKDAGISVSTARDVRNRVLAGEYPVPPRLQTAREAGTPAPRAELGDVKMHMDKLRHDPTLRYSDSGRALLRCLDTGMAALGHLRTLAGPDLPLHCRASVTLIVRAYAQAWSQIADDLAHRVPDLRRPGDAAFD